MLLDEPTSNLDARARREFSDLLERLKSAGKTLLFCTHRPSEVWKLADRVIVLERGCKVSAEGPPEQVREYLLEPAHLCLFVPIEESAAAAALLSDGGFDVQRTGSRLWVDAAAGRKDRGDRTSEQGAVCRSWTLTWKLIVQVRARSEQG